MNENPPLFAGIGGHHSPKAGTDVWLTPPFVLDAVGGAESFDLDPAASDDRPWPTARQHYTRADNGLIRAWNGRVWLNPPYSTALIRWMARMAEHNRGVALIFARTETEAFFRHVWERASALLFLEGRLNFHYPDGTRAGANSGAPSVLCAYGQADAEILGDCVLPGAFVPLTLPRGVAVAMINPRWVDVVRDVVRRRAGPVRLDDLYRALARHPKSRGNPNYQAKIRQTLQQGQFTRVARGVWAA